MHENKDQTVFETQFKSVFKSKRLVAYAILPLIDAELTRLEQNGIISQIKYSN